MGSSFLPMCEYFSLPFHYLISYLLSCCLLLPVKIMGLAYLGPFDVISCLVMHVDFEGRHCLDDLWDNPSIFLYCAFNRYFYHFHNSKNHYGSMTTHCHHWRHTHACLFSNVNLRKNWIQAFIQIMLVIKTF